jgi:sulfite reductase (ferredoxin)
MRRLAAIGITTREACGNSVRNVTACTRAGVCCDQAFDVSPHAQALARFLLGHRDAQAFGRKFKIAFSGCEDKPCGLARLHDLGLIAKRQRGPDGRLQRGFTVLVGGGLGPVPYQAKVLYEFLAEEELFPVAQAICRVFARLGEKRNRARARIKFLVAKLGLEEFRRLVVEERATLQPDSRWTDYLAQLGQETEVPLRPGQALADFEQQPPAFRRWFQTNVSRQAQEGYASFLVSLPLGDVTVNQMHALADLARRFTGDTVRITVDQNLAFRWASETDLPAIHRELQAIHLAEASGDTIQDVTACPGTDTCKLGIAASRGLARELRRRLIEANATRDPLSDALRIKTSGCFNSCGQHHIADLGFYGVSRKVGGYTVPHFQVVLGGTQRHNAGAYGLAVCAVPSKRIPEAASLITQRYLDNRHEDEDFQSFVKRAGKATIRAWLEPLTRVPPHAQDPSFYSDWGDPREYTTGDMGVGECAGEVISPVQFGLADSERIAFEAQLKLEQGAIADAASLAFDAMVKAARTLVQIQLEALGDDPLEIIREFRQRFFDTTLFFDPFLGGKFASYLFRAAEDNAVPSDLERARQRVEEAQLFIEAAHACYGRMTVA